MKRIFCLLFLVAVMATWCSSGFAARQVIPAGNTESLNFSNTGSIDGVTLGSAASTLNVDGFGGASGDIADAGGVLGSISGGGITNFTVNGTIAGNVGTAGLNVDQVNVNAGASAVNFNGTVFATTISIAAGNTATLNSGTDANKGAVTFTGDGTLNIGANSWLTGAVNAGADNRGTLVLNSGSDLEGAPGGAFALRSINVAGNTVAAKITGAVNTHAFSLLTNTLNINGAITLTTAGTIGTTIASSTVWGNIVQTGAGAVGLGTGLVVNANVTGFIPNGAQFVLVDGTGALTTGTSSVISSDPYVSFSTSVAGGKFILTANRSGAGGGFAGVSTDPNASAAGGVLDNVTNPSSDMTTILDALSDSSASQVSSSVKSMTPTTDGAVTQASTAMLNNFINNTETRLCNVRTTSGNTGIASGDDYLNGIDIWAQGLGDYAHQDPRGSSNGYNATSWGFSGGGDKVFFNDSIRLGLGSGYGQTSVRSKDFSGRTDIYSILATVYGSYQNCMYPFYIDSAFTFVHNKYNGSRQVTAGPTITRTANADYDGQQYSGYIEGGYGFFYKKLSLTPLASFNYTRLHTESYTETNAGALNLNVASQDYDMAQTGLGAKVMYPIDLKYGTLTPDVHFKWLYDWVGDNQASTASFAGGGTSFGTNGFAPAKSAYNFGARLNLSTKYNVTIGLDYDFLFKENYYEHYGTVTAKYSF